MTETLTTPAGKSVQAGRWAVAALFFVNGFIMGAWAPQIPLLMPRHDIREGVLGLLILLVGVGAVGAMLFAGKLLNRYGSSRMALVFGLAVAPMLPLVVLAPSLWLIAPALVLFGATTGCMDVSMNANSVAVERRLGRAIMSSSHGFWSVGGFVGGAAGAYVTARFGAEAQAIGVGAVSALIVLVASSFLHYDPPHPAEASAPKAAMFPKVGLLYLLGMMALFSMVPEGAVLDWAAIYISKELGADLQVAGLGFALFSGAMAMMRFLGDSVRNRFGAVRTLQVSGGFGVAGLAIAAAAPAPAVAIAGCFIAGLGIANMVPILFSAAGNVKGLSAGAGIATVTMMGYAGILLAPSTIGFVAQHAGFRMTYAALAVLLAVVAAMAGKAASADEIRGH